MCFGVGRCAAPVPRVKVRRSGSVGVCSVLFGCVLAVSSGRVQFGAVEFCYGG